MGAEKVETRDQSSILLSVVGLIPITFVWTVTGLFVLIYLFDMIAFIKSGALGSLNDFLVMFIWGLPAGLTISFTGHNFLI